MATKKQPVIRAGAHGDLALDKTERNTYLKQVSRLRKLLKDDKVDLDTEAALTIVAQCSDMKDRNGTALGECEPGFNCPDLSLLKNSSDARVRQIYQTRAVRGGKAWQCVPRELIMAEDIPRDGNQEYEFNDAVAQLATEVKNINNIQRWHSAIKGRYCNVINQALVGGQGFEEKKPGHREQANRNARDLCGRTALCNWVPDKYSADDDVRKQWEQGKYDVDEDGKPIKLPEEHNYDPAIENPGRCLPTIDDLARTIQAEARTLEGLVPKTPGENGTLTTSERLTRAIHATEEAKRKYQKEKHFWGLIGAGERQQPPTPLTQVQKAQPGLEELNTMWNTYSAAKRTQKKVQDMHNKYTSDVPESYMKDKLKQRLRKSRMWEDFDGKCVAAGEIPGATYEDCRTTSMNPDDKLKEAEGVCAVISGTTGDIQNGEKTTRLSDTDQCRVKEGEGSTWNRVHDPTNHRYEVESIRSAMPDADMFQAIHAAGNDVNLPSSSDDADLKDFVKRTTDLKTQVKDQFSKTMGNDQSIFAAGGTAAILKQLDSQVSDGELIGGYLVGNINTAFETRKAKLKERRPKDLDKDEQKKIKRYESNIDYSIRMQLVKDMQDFLDPILSNATVHIKNPWSEDDRKIFASKTDKDRAGEHFRNGTDLIHTTDTDEFPVIQAGDDGDPSIPYKTRKYTVSRYNMTDDGVDMWLTDGHDSKREFARWGNITNLTGTNEKFLIVPPFTKRVLKHYDVYRNKHAVVPQAQHVDPDISKSFKSLSENIDREQIQQIKQICTNALTQYQLALDTKGYETSIEELVVDEILKELYSERYGNGKIMYDEDSSTTTDYYTQMIESKIYRTTKRLQTPDNRNHIDLGTTIFLVDTGGNETHPVRFLVSHTAKRTWKNDVLQLSSVDAQKLIRCVSDKEQREDDGQKQQKEEQREDDGQKQQKEDGRDANPTMKVNDLVVIRGILGTNEGHNGKRGYLVAQRKKGWLVRLDNQEQEEIVVGDKYIHPVADLPHPYYKLKKKIESKSMVHEKDSIIRFEYTSRRKRTSAYKFMFHNLAKNRSRKAPVTIVIPQDELHEYFDDADFLISIAKHEERQEEYFEEYYDSTAFESDTASHFGDVQSLQGLE